MKKRIIYSSVLTALLSASSIALAGGPEIIPEPDYFSGWYVGGIGGVHHNTFDGSSTVNLTQSIVTPTIIINPITLVGAGQLNNTTVSGGDFNGYGGLQGGFGKVINHAFYVGVQGWGEWGSTSTTESQTASIPFGGAGIPFFIPPARFGVFTPLTASATTSTTMKISNDYGVAAKLGWVVAPRSMIYGKIGASWADIQVSNSLNVNSSSTTTIQNFLPVSTLVVNSATSLSANSSTDDNSKVGLLLGAGFEQFVYQDIVSLNVEYDYTNYGSVNSPLAFLSGSNTISGTFTPAEGAAVPFNSGPRPINTNVATSASSNAKVSQLMAGINFYFGRDWF